MNMEFDFSIDYQEEIEEVVPYSDTTEIDCENIVKRILKGKKILLGERMEGSCVIKNDVVTLDYRVCTELGDDWNTDVWGNEKTSFPLSEI